MKVLIVGASRGIGLEFVRAYRADRDDVYATARSESALMALRELGAHPINVDVTDVQSVSRLAWELDGVALDVVVICAGVYGPRSSALQAPTDDEFNAVMRTNVLGPMRVLQQVSEALAPHARIAILSSKMGSIGERSNAGGWVYRASKAAVNSVTKDAALTLAKRAIVACFHPGWVKTDMGGAGADLTVQQSVADLRRVIARLTPADSGRFFNHDGTPIAW